ncbi:MAG: hypothetical protein U9Q81_18940 [Pseudomonadota bacterium]|nr:hypothetical protein [Pseudomonadota bacterium]
MAKQGFEQRTAVQDIDYLREKIKNLTPPCSDQDELLLEIYEQLLEKHAEASSTAFRH